MRRFGGVALVFLVLVAGLASPVLGFSEFGPRYPWDTGPGTLTYALNAPDGEEVALYGVSVMPRRNTTYEANCFHVREPWEFLSVARTIRIDSQVLVEDWQPLDIVGKVWTIGGERVISPAAIYAWTDRSGKILGGIWPNTFRHPTTVLCTESALPWRPTNKIKPETWNEPRTLSTGMAKTVNNEPWTIPLICLKRLPDGAEVAVSQRILVGYRDWSYDTLFLEEPDSSCGIKVRAYGIYDAQNQPVSFRGVLTTENGVRVLQYLGGAVDVHTSVGLPRRFGMMTKMVGGGKPGGATTWTVDSDGAGPDNIGRLVTVAGRTTCDPYWPDCSYVYHLEDGCGLQNGALSAGIRVRDNLYTLPSHGEFLVVTGVANVEYEAGVPVREVAATAVCRPETDCTAGASREHQAVTCSVSTTSGTVDVTVYTERGAITVTGANQTAQDVCLPGVPKIAAQEWGPISATAPGYKSVCVKATGNPATATIQMEPWDSSDLFMHIESDKVSIAACEGDSATITAMHRDIEGKPLPGDITLTTDKGYFDDDINKPKQIVKTPNEWGIVTAVLKGDTLDASGTATITAASSAQSGTTGVRFSTTWGINVMAEDDCTVTAQLFGMTQLSGHLITMTTDQGIFGNGQTTFSAYTDASGKIGTTISASGNCPVRATVTAVADGLCGCTDSQQVDINCDGTCQVAAVEIFFCIDSTGSMGGETGGHRATASVQKFLQDMANEHVRFRLGGLKFNEGQSDCDDTIDMMQLSSLNSFTSVESFISNWVNNLYSPHGGDGPELQLDALHIAAQDMSANSMPGNPQRYIVLITDNTFHENQCGSTVTKQQVINELIASGCKVHISLWDPGSTLLPVYNNMNVNTGEFDAANYDPLATIEDKYPLTNLRCRITND